MFWKLRTIGDIPQVFSHLEPRNEPWIMMFTMLIQDSSQKVGMSSGGLLLHDLDPTQERRDEGVVYPQTVFLDRWLYRRVDKELYQDPVLC
jgi:hypothetical protein